LTDKQPDRLVTHGVEASNIARQADWWIDNTWSGDAVTLTGNQPDRLITHGVEAQSNIAKHKQGRR
jgi:hypothetical protein